MKHVLIAATLLASSFVAKAQHQSDAHTLTVNVTDLKTASGAVYISLQDPTQKAVQKQAVPIQKNNTQIVFQNVPPGTYAVRLFHDENNNKKMDTGIFGIPKEGWGCSNNVKATFGPPKYDAMLFTVNTDKAITIHIN
ncbi:DUF2141 domain-containing protein [Spirosoma agri]|uniref:DUF2141 domain-containing protein n=1 Tax=Spirosoma agri TaxID=1987381 RepID=A0A6M0IP99_9BACT|nr:DUF2141 domain-containing protein [Spirosoma agri]NEU69762.1 DUF2141 domain-containing protein [Spirosoma agri]